MTNRLSKRFIFPKLGGVVCLLAVASLAGCGKFFPPLNPPCTSNCTTSTNFMYVANSSDTNATPPSVAGFSLTTSSTSTLTLAVTPNSTYALPAVPTALVVTPNDKYLYVATTSGIYLYAINTDGSITLQNNSTAVASGLVSSMKVDSTGSWVVVANTNSPSANSVISVYPIAGSTGLLSTPNTTTLNHVGAIQQIAFAPDNSVLFAALGVGGTEGLTFDATKGILTDVSHLATPGAAFAQNAVTVDPKSAYAFIAETGGTGVRVYKIGSNASLTQVSGSPFATGTGPSAVLVDSSDAYVYVTNRTSNNISAFVFAAGNGTLTAVAGSPFDTGTNPVDIAEDASKTYVGVVCNGGGQDLEVYSFDATTGGKLDTAANATTGTDPTLAIALATTH